MSEFLGGKIKLWLVSALAVEEHAGLLKHGVCFSTAKSRRAVIKDTTRTLRGNRSTSAAPLLLRLRAPWGSGGGNPGALPRAGGLGASGLSGPAARQGLAP